MFAFVTGCGVVAVLISVLMGRAALRRGGILAALRGLAIALVFLALGLSAMGFGMALRAFEAFSGSRLIAQVRCRWVGPKEFELLYTPIRSQQRPQPTRTVRLRGDQWSISGGVVKWHPWLTALGLPSYHRPSRLAGRYADVAQETAQPPTAVELAGEPDRVWWWFYRLDPWLPFVDAVYGSAAYIYVNPAMLCDVSVTPSGYLIERKRLPRDMRSMSGT